MKQSLVSQQESTSRVSVLTFPRVMPMSEFPAVTHLTISLLNNSRRSRRTSG